MTLEYFGHSFWKISTKDVSIVIDPFDNIGYPMPKNLTADYVVISHEHHDHNNISLVQGIPTAIRTSGAHEFKHFIAELISVFHDETGGAKRGKNNIIKLTLENMVLVHCGDLGHLPSAEVLAKIQSPDVLLVPVGEVYTLALKEVWQFIQQINPQIIIPMHYQTPKLSFHLGSLQNFLKDAREVVYQRSNKIEINPQTLQQSRIIVVDWEH